MQKITPFHLAIPVSNLQEARDFYGKTLELPQGRSDKEWTDYNFFGHQLVIHHDANAEKNLKASSSVDGKSVPIPHFGVVLDWKDFFAFAEELKNKKITFEIAPYIRFEGKVGEQATMFFTIQVAML